MDKRQIFNYINVTGLICYIIGHLTNISLLSWIGLSIIVLSSIWTIINWKENNKITNYSSVAVCLAFLVYIAVSLFRL